MFAYLFGIVAVVILGGTSIAVSHGALFMTIASVLQSLK